MTAACPVCASAGAARIESHRDPVGGKTYELLQCPACALVYASPLEFPGADWYGKYNYVCGYEETAAAMTKSDFPYFLDRLPHPRRGLFLDIGCAAGHFLRLAAQRGYDVEGLEVDERFVAQARAAGLTGVRQGALDDAFAREREGRYDVVSMIEVLEHLDDPVGFLRLAGRLLKPGGRLLIAVPDTRRRTPFGRDSWDYPPHHLTRWSPKALRLALEKGGFIVEDLRSKPIPVVDFSRVWADRSAQCLLRLFKLVRYGRGAASRPMDEILAARSSGGKATALPDKSRRVRMVFAYHAVFNFVTYPLFALLRLYYRLARPDAGHTLLAISRKP
jgi:SAM-dependent methyltransferase